MNAALEKIKAHAKTLDFCAMGVTQTLEPPHYKDYLNWIDQGYHQNMWYLAEASRKAKRASAAHLLPNVQSILVGALSYHSHTRHRQDAIKFARYGWGADYHSFVKDRFTQLCQYMTEDLGLSFDAKITVDTAPVLERDFALLAGVGWMGKNTMIMNQKNGSYIYLGAMLTSLDLPSDAPVTAHCGSCTACIDTCPTQAIEEPFKLNPSKCISYHTIENKTADIPESIKAHLHGWVAGCDICQDVCPWNRKAAPGEARETHQLDHASLNAHDILNMDEASYKNVFAKTAFARIPLAKLKQNVKAALDLP